MYTSFTAYFYKQLKNYDNRMFLVFGFFFFSDTYETSLYYFSLLEITRPKRIKGIEILQIIG